MTTCGRDEDRDDPAGAEDALDGYVRAFEEAYAQRGVAEPSAFLPPAGHPLRAAVLRELVRVDLEYGWGRGRPKGLGEYLLAFPDLADDRDGLREIAFEEYRLRHQAGQCPAPDEYLTRHGVRLGPEAGRFRPPGPGLQAPKPRPRGQDGRRADAPRVGDGHSLAHTLSRDGDDRGEAPALPEVGDDFLGFRLTGELGRGSFGRVYLARQGDLADRPVVLKVTADGCDESQTLAQLQHENIVPVYSRHREGRLRAVCMPYLGSVTLRDVVDDLKGMGAMPESGRGLLSSLGKSGARKGPAPAPPEPPPRSAAAAGRDPGPGRDGATDNRAVLGRLTYVEAVVWMGARLADGLAHAHDRGILHRDIKPANVLLTDDGRPLLLDFNLAEDVKLREPGAGAPAAVGGTLPYMAPEHLAAFRDGGREVDARSDVYAFGVILFEMLTGRPPFPVRDGLRPDVIAAMIADRRGAPPRVRPWNPAASPAVESVVRRCLDPDPARRYASARELAEDLHRHLGHRPLRYAPEPSRLERAAKWGRRNRRGLAAAAVLAVAAAVVGGFTLALGSRADRLDRLEAEAALRRFRAGAESARLVLDTYVEADADAKRVEGLAAVDAALAEFRVRDDHDRAPDWWLRRPASRLDPADRGASPEVGDLLMAAARAEAGGPEAGRRLRDALRDNDRAGRCFAPGQPPRAYWTRRAALLGSLGDPRGAKLAADRGEAARLTGGPDHYLLACELAHQGRYAEAGDQLDAALRAAPGLYRAWFLAGYCHDRRKNDDRALACLDTCIALWAGHPAAWYNRGVIALRRGRPGQAAADLDEALRLRPGDPDALANRGLAALELGRPSEAVRWFDRAAAAGSRYTRLYFMRARAREAAGDPGGARLDREEGLRREPTDELSWVSRALHRARAEPPDVAGGLADLDRALALNPSSFNALQNRAYLLAERLGRTVDAVAVYDRLLTIYPDQDAARVFRGVLLARLGRREAALADLDTVLDRHPTPFFRLQAACVYALTSRQDPGDRAEALRFFAAALGRSPALAELAGDADLSAIRDDPVFARTVAAAKAAARATTRPPRQTTPHADL